MVVPGVSHAASGRVLKVLPMYFDHTGRHMLSPSLYERDAYQFYLRQHPELRAGMKFSVQWKAKGRSEFPFILRLELRGIAKGDLPRQMILMKFVRPRGLFSDWTELLISADDYTAFGEVTAWRVSLWEIGSESEILLGEQKSFLW